MGKEGCFNAENLECALARSFLAGYLSLLPKVKMFSFFFLSLFLSARVAKSDFAFAGNDCFDSLGLGVRLKSLRGIVFC